MVHICLVWPMNETVGDTIGELHYTHRAAYGSETIGIKTAESILLLDALECEFPEVFVVMCNGAYIWIKLHSFLYMQHATCTKTHK